jgi:hypothetical protein
LIKLPCFAAPDINGNYLSASDYAIAPKIQYAVKEFDKVAAEAREAIRASTEEAQRRM